MAENIVVYSDKSIVVFYVNTEIPKPKAKKKQEEKKTVRKKRNRNKIIEMLTHTKCAAAASLYLIWAESILPKYLLPSTIFFLFAAVLDSLHSFPNIYV